jgi:phosphatidate cytidylyltransferase
MSAPARSRPRARRQTPHGARRPGRTSTTARVAVAVPWVLFAIVIIHFGGTVFAIALVGLGLVSLHELYRMLQPVRPLTLAGFAGAAGLILAAAYGDQFQIVLAAVLSVLVTFLLALTRERRRYVTLSIAATLLGVFWIGLALAHAVLLRDLDHGDGLIVDVLIATFLGDTGAYFGGRAWGVHPLAPEISPSKTVEGLISGFVTATIAFFCAGLYQDWLSGTEALAMGACVGAAAPLGDLFESMIKRDLTVKDTGRFFGEHGGALDRLDAAFFTVVVGYYVARVLL